MEAMAVRPEGVVGDRYRLLDLVGRGGMGGVWTAEDEDTGRLVAVKEVTPPRHLSQAERRRVQQRVLLEARSAAELRCASAVRVVDVLAEQETAWVVMEWLAAPSLDDVLRDSGPLTVRETAAVGQAMLDALRQAHAAGVLHRDVRPANVAFTYRGAVLTDYGIAIRDGDPAPRSADLVVWSPAYIAPERARGQPAGPPADVWSVGATLYAAVEGGAPFDRDGDLATLHAVVHDEPTPPLRAGPLEPVLRRLLDKDPAMRPTADQARTLLAQLGGRAGGLGGGRTVSRLPPLPEADPPPRRRLSGAALRIGAVALVLAVLGVLGVAVAAAGLLPDVGADTDQGASGSATVPEATGSTEPTEPTGPSEPTEPAQPAAPPGRVAVPAPFRSAALYGFSRYLFAPSECRVPRPGEFPIAEIAPDTELVKCEDPQFSGTFWCKAEADGLVAERRIYLSRADEGTTRALSAPPVGRTAPVDGIQVAYNHGIDNEGRVLWDSPAAGCGAELQARSDDLGATVDHWLTGPGS